MALITGSSTIDWSGISLAQVDFEGDLVKFVNRLVQILIELGNGQFVPIFFSPTLLVVDLFSGGKSPNRGLRVRRQIPIYNQLVQL